LKVKEIRSKSVSGTTRRAWYKILSQRR